jgi:hypothetical protein
MGTAQRTSSGQRSRDKFSYRRKRFTDNHKPPLPYPKWRRTGKYLPKLEIHEWVDQNKVNSSALVGNYPIPYSKKRKSSGEYVGKLQGRPAGMRLLLFSFLLSYSSLRGCMHKHDLHSLHQVLNYGRQVCHQGVVE